MSFSSYSVAAVTRTSHDVQTELPVDDASFRNKFKVNNTLNVDEDLSSVTLGLLRSWKNFCSRGDDGDFHVADARLAVTGCFRNTSASTCFRFLLNFCPNEHKT